MSSFRPCSRAHCNKLAIATLTFDYKAASAVLGPLAPHPLDGALDLCEKHAVSITVPVGWELLRLEAECNRSAQVIEKASRDDGLTALAQALRESEREAAEKAEQIPPTGNLSNPWESHVVLPPMRPHLRVIDGGADE